MTYDDGVPKGTVSESGRWLVAMLVSGLRQEELEAPDDGRIRGDVVGAAFNLAARRRFAGPGDIRAISRYVAEALPRCDLPADGRLAREAEAIIRSTFGELELIEDLAPQATIDLGFSLLIDLVYTMGLSEEEIAALVRAAERVVDQMHGRMAREKLSPKGLWRRWTSGRPRG